MTDDKPKKYNIYSPDTIDYYRDVLQNIVDITYDYDGYDIEDVQQMKELLDDLKQMAIKALNREELYVKVDYDKIMVDKL